MVNASESAWRPSCTEDELLVVLVAVKRALQTSTAGVDPGAFPVLHHLAALGPARPGTLAEALGLDASTVSRHVRSLVEDGLIESARDPVDGRATVLSLNDAGQEYLAERLRRHREALRAATSAFTPHERGELVRLLRKFADALGDRKESA